MATRSQRMRQLMDWRAALWAGVIAGVIFLLLNLFLISGLVGSSPWVLLRLLASVLLGPGIQAPPATFDLGALIAALVTGWIKAMANSQPVPAMPFPDAYTPTDALHWYGLGAHPTPWYASADFQLPVILVFLFVFVLALIASLLPWLKFGGGLPRLALGLAAAANTFLLAELLYVISYLLNADAESASPVIPLGEWLFQLAWLSVVLAASLAYFWRKARGQSGNGFGRAVFTLMTLAAWGFIPFLAYWGVLGGRL